MWRLWDLILEEDFLTFTVFSAIGAYLKWVIYIWALFRTAWLGERRWDGSVCWCWGWEGSYRSVCAVPRRSSHRGRWVSPPESDVRQTVQENKACDLRELCDRFRYSWQRGCETISWPSPRCLAPSQHHLWLGVHLFCITVPPLDSQLAVESQLSKNDTEFEDTSWKNTLLMQLRFPCVTDKCNRTRMTDQLFFHWSSRIC